MKLYSFFTLIIIGVLFLSCDKKEKLPPKYKIEYHFINNGDPDIYLMTGDESTVFPDEKINDMQGRDFHCNPYDTFIISPDILGYKGVKMYMSIGIRKEWDGKDDVRRWELPIRVVDSEADRIMKFVYPEDTLTATRTK